MDHSTLEYRAPEVIVRKPNVDIRVCRNYRALNKVTILRNYSLTNIKILKLEIHSLVFSVLDSKDGYYQIPVHIDTVKSTAVCVVLLFPTHTRECLFY